MAGHLTLHELLHKLERLDRLMKIHAWDTQANTDYWELFDVDKEAEATGRTHVRYTWRDSHRLSSFQWDEACEYPLPVAGDDGGSAGGGITQDTRAKNSESPASFSFDVADTCHMKALIGSLAPQSSF